MSVDGKMGPSKREEVLSLALNSAKSVVSNCKLLSTGVDEAHWDLVYMADPVRSVTQVQQMIGRVSRPAPNKERGYVLVPLPGDSDDTIDTESEYDLMGTVFEAMVAGDPMLRRDVVFVADVSKRLGRPLTPSEYPGRIPEAFMFPSSMSLEQSNGMLSRLVIEVGKMDFWEDMFSLLETYKIREGHCNVPLIHEEDEANLGTWVS